MGQFKPMVKMNTTEPSVELKLKTGGSASFKRMHSEGAKEGFKPVKKMNGGVMDALSRTPTPTTPVGNPSAARAMASKRPPMRAPAAPARGMPAVGRPAAPMPAPTMGRPMMKKGGSVPASGIIKTMTNKTTKVVGAKPDHNSAPTGDVKMGNAGGYKKGGAAKKHFATGGAVNNSGHAVAMPKKAPSKPVAITELSGTFKKGGRVC